MDTAMVTIVRRYEVLAGFVRQFTRAYGSEGDWAALFSETDGFLGMQLLEGSDGSYLVIEQWRSERDFASFMCDHSSQYEALSRIAEGWALEDTLIGRFRPIVGPAAHKTKHSDCIESTSHRPCARVSGSNETLAR